MSPAPFELEFVAHANVAIDTPLELGEILAGRRRIIPIVGGTFAGPLLNATILPGGADWQTITPEGTAIIDTRYYARTDDGHIVSIATSGFRHGPPAVMARLAAGEDVPPSDYVFRVSARLECSAPELAWVNRTVFVASAARFRSLVTYDLFAVR
jgi:Protein of unknown function (DUF3237)